MSAEHRRENRKSSHIGATIDFQDGRPLWPCVISDISKTGARLLINNGLRDIPQKIILRFTEDGKVRRYCRVAWQSSGEAGVEFQ